MKKITSALLSLVLAISFIGCSKKEGPKEDKKLQSITIGIMPSVDAIPFIIAEDKGLFKKQGLDVKLETFKSAKDRDAALQAGALDAVSSDLVGVGLLKKGGLDLKITGVTDGKFQLVANKDSGIKSIEDLKGKKTVISKNTVIEFTLDSILETAKLSDKDVVKEEIPQIPVRLEMLRNNKVDSALLPEPFSSLAMKDGAVLISDTEKLGIAPGVSAFTKKAIDGKKEEIKAFYKAYDEAVEYIQKESLSSFEDLIIEKIGYPKDMKGSIVLPKFRKTTLPKDSELEAAVKWLKDRNLADKDLKATDLVDNIAVR